MEEEKLKHFIENMRMAGQPDDMIAESLIDAGNNKLVVLNAFGVSSVEELREQPEEESEDENSTPMPMVDNNGNIMFGTQENPAEPGDILKPAPAAMPVEATAETTEEQIDEPKPESQAGERVYPRPAPREAKVEHVTVPERTDEDEELEEKMQTPRPEAPDAFELHGGGFIAIPIQRSHEKPAMLKQEAPVDDASEENNESDADEEPSHKDTREEAPEQDEADTSDEKPEDDAHDSDDNESHHAHHHSPHTYSETMEDVTDHEELEPGFEGQVEADTSEDEDDADSEKLDDEDDNGNTNDSSDQENEPEVSDEPIRRLETAFQEKEKELDKKLGSIPPKLAPEEPELEKDPELPQEIEVTELEAIPTDDTHELQKAIKEDVAEAVAEAPKQPVHQAKTVDAAPVPTAPEMQHAGDTAKSILGNVWLKVSLIVLVVAILVLLAISVMTRVSDGLSFSG